jgi:hypothetical protein
MKTPIETFLAVDGAGGKLGIVGDKLRMLLPADCRPELKEAIRQHKSALLELLRLKFVVVHSDILNTTVLWTPDEATKEFLVTHGADRGDIYSAPELEQVVNRRVTPEQLLQIHAVKKRFNGKLTEP